VLESNFAFSRFNINAPAQSTLEVNAEQAMDKVMDEISSRFHSLEDELNKASDDCNKLQMAISEKRSLHSLEDQKRDSTRQKMNQHESVGGSIEQVSQMVKDLRAFEEKNSISTPHNVSEVRPDELLDYLDQRLESEESESVEGIQPDLVKKIVKRLKKLAQRDGEVSCPCCERGFDSQDSITVFAQKMNVLMAEDSPLLKADEKSQQSKSNYVKWRKTMTSNMNNIMDYKRMAQEVDEMKKRLKELEKFVVEKSEEHNKAKEKHTELQTEVGELRALLDSAKMWQVAANRLDGKRIQAGAKDHDILMGSSTESHGRDLKTVERDISEKNQKKDEHSEKVSIWMDLRWAYIYFGQI
jgi:chromosome segregation ATPase